jgi:hypothetical protein
MIAVIVDTISIEDIFEDLERYRTVFYLNTSNRASKLYSKLKKLKSGLEIKINTKDAELVERIAKAIGLEFAEYKEPVHVWIDCKCVVY